MLLKRNKSQTDQIQTLKEKLNQLESDSYTKDEIIENWKTEKEDINQQRNDLKDELYSYMNRFSELQIHKESLEIEFRNQLKTNEDKLHSNLYALEEKDNQVIQYLT